MNINANLIAATRRYYQQNITRVKLENKLTLPFETKKGVKQSSCLSPTLFKIYLDRSLVRWTKECKSMGLRVGDDNLFTLYFGDDQIVVAEHDEDLEYMVRKLKEEYDAAGLTMNMVK